MKRIAKAAMVVSLAMAAGTALADGTSAFPQASSAYYNSITNAPVVTNYGNVPPAQSGNVVAQSTYAQQSGQWHSELANAPVTYEPSDATAAAGYANWPEVAEGAGYWTTHAPGGKPLPGTAEAAQEQHRLAQLHQLSGG